MTLDIRPLTGAELDSALADVARLRMTVFRDWPYLYDGDLAYEEHYLQSYRTSPGAIVVGAFDGKTLVGAATGTPVEDHADDFAQALTGQDVPPVQIFYCAESVLLPDYRGQGAGHRFFDLREAHARTLGRTYAAFCAVIRPAGHPARPEVSRDLVDFWTGRGYHAVPGAIAQFSWRDLGQPDETVKDLQFWMKPLGEGK